MALRFIDGFDHYSTLAQVGYKYNETGTSSYVSLDTGRRAGSNALKLYSSSGYATRVLDDQATWIVGAAVKIGAMPSSTATIFMFRDNSGSAQDCVCITSTGTISLLRGTSSGTVLATSSNALTVGAWNYIEAKLTIASSGGTFEVRVNGDVWATFTGNTKYSSTLSTANGIKLYGLPSAVNAWYDDFYICDGTGSSNNTYLGDARVDTIFPSGAGASAQFTPTGSTNNWENVDESSPNDDTDYNAADTAGYLSLIHI